MKRSETKNCRGDSGRKKAMTIEEFYQSVDGDYETVLENMITEEYVLKFMEMFLDDPNYARLTDALARGDDEDAFKAVHTLKGVAANLSYGRLYEAAVAVTEELRGGRDPQKAREYMPQLTKEYEFVIGQIRRLIEDKA